MKPQGKVNMYVYLCVYIQNVCDCGSHTYTHTQTHTYTRTPTFLPVKWRGPGWSQCLRRAHNVRWCKDGNQREIAGALRQPCGKTESERERERWYSWNHNISVPPFTLPVQHTKNGTFSSCIEYDDQFLWEYEFNLTIPTPKNKNNKMLQ